MSSSSLSSAPTEVPDFARKRESQIVPRPDDAIEPAPVDLDEVMSPRPLITLHYWPLVLIEMPRIIDDAGIHEVTSAMEVCFARQEPFVVIGDTGNMRRPPSATQRRAIAEFAKANAGSTRRFAVGTAYVVTNTVIRGALDALNWIFRPTTPAARFRTRTQAIDWCVKILEEGGIDGRHAAAQLFRDGQLNREFAEVL